MKLADAVARKVIKADNTNILALVTYGDILRKTQIESKYGQAIKMYSRAKSLLPAELERVAGVATEGKQGSWEAKRAQDVLNTASQRAAFGLVWIWTSQAKYAEAKRFLDSLSEHESNSSWVCLSRSIFVLYLFPNP